MYALASELATFADSAASGPSNLTSTSRLLRIGDTVRLRRNRSIAADCTSVSAASVCLGRLGGDLFREPTRHERDRRSHDPADRPGVAAPD